MKRIMLLLALLPTFVMSQSSKVTARYDVDIDQSTGNVKFDATASVDSFGRLVIYEWEFGDGKYKGTKVPYVEHTYTADTYISRLRVWDEHGIPSKWAEKTIVVPSAGFVISFEVNDSYWGDSSGYYKMAFIIDGRIVWLKDVSGGMLSYDFEKVRLLIPDLKTGSHIFSIKAQCVKSIPTDYVMIPKMTMWFQNIVIGGEKINKWDQITAGMNGEARQLDDNSYQFDFNSESKVGNAMQIIKTITIK